MSPPSSPGPGIKTVRSPTDLPVDRLYGVSPGLGRRNVFRTVTLARGAHPEVLVLDNIWPDQQEVWTATTATDGRRLPAIFI